MNLPAVFFFSVLTAAVAQVSSAQEPQADPFTKFIVEMVQTNQGKSLCVGGSTSVHALRTNVVNHLKATGAERSATPQVVAAAIWSLYPCPFSPVGANLRPATENEITGVWLFPENSQKLRFPPKSQRQTPAGPMQVKCDAVGYYPNGELRHALIAGRATCPFEKAADMDVARKNPRVSDWSLLRPGHIGVTRTDVANHIEEWDVYSVVAPFSFSNVSFEVGDLVAYARRENGNEVGAATQFRHLKRLP